MDRRWGSLIVLIMGKCGPRLGEAMGLVVSSCCRLRPEIEASIAGDLTLNAYERAQRTRSIIDLPHGYAIDPGRRVITVTEVVEWDSAGSRPHLMPPEERSSGKVPKSKKDRWTIYPMSMADPIVSRCTELLVRFGPELGPSVLLFPAHDHRFVQVPVAAAYSQSEPMFGTRTTNPDGVAA